MRPFFGCGYPCLLLVPPSFEELSPAIGALTPAIGALSPAVLTSTIARGGTWRRKHSPLFCSTGASQSLTSSQVSSGVRRSAQPFVCQHIFQFGFFFVSRTFFVSLCAGMHVLYVRNSGPHKIHQITRIHAHAYH